MRSETDGTPRGKGQTGLSLLKVLIATLVFMLAAIPIYRAISVGAAKQIDSTKLSMARKILDSFRSEVMSRSFKELADQNPSGSETFVKLSDEYLKNLEIDNVMKSQVKYKAFKLEPELRFTTPKKTIHEFRGVVKWKNSEATVQREEIIFLVVKP